MRAGHQMLTGLALLAALAGSACAQDARLVRRLPQPTRDSVQAIVNAARAEHLPTEPLVDRALEGEEKGVAGPRIVVAVRSLAGELRTARRALGARSDSDEVKAGAHAIHAGASPAALASLRAARPQRRLTMAVTVLTDLVTRQVPSDSAAATIRRLLRADVSDAELSAFQRDVHSDIERGGDPTTATQTRARGLLVRVAGP